MKVVPVLEGELLIPGRFRPGAEPVCVSMHFWLGDAAMMRAFDEVGFNAVHYNNGFAGRSNQFRKPFATDLKLFERILSEVEGAIRRECSFPHLRVGNIAISAFSAGYAAVREILKDPANFQRIKTLIMTDTIYADWVSDTVRVPKLEQMIDFMRFAQAAARGEKTMIVSHIDYDCDRAGYCSTRKTADLLLASVGGQRQVVTASSTPPGATSTCDIGNFHLLHFGNRNHIHQLALIPQLWRLYGLGKALSGGVKPVSCS